jgi:hypothetical protein
MTDVHTYGTYTRLLFVMRRADFRSNRAVQSPEKNPGHDTLTRSEEDLEQLVAPNRHQCIFRRPSLAAAANFILGRVVFPDQAEMSAARLVFVTQASLG